MRDYKTSHIKPAVGKYRNAFVARSTFLRGVVLNLPGEGQDHTKKINQGSLCGPV